MDDLPLLARRTAFLTKQTHMPYHSGMTLLLRERMRALIAAYFAPDDGPLLRLRKQFGVTHLIVEWAHFSGAPPSYFRPFDKDIRRAVRNLRGRKPSVLAAAERASVYRDSTYALLDLALLERSR
jgi:hypothetical protein